MQKSIPDSAGETMKTIVNDQTWHKCNSSFVTELSGCTSNPGYVFPANTACLPSSMMNMPGLESIYVSGYVNPEVVETGVLSAYGEFVVTRTEEDLRKAYNYAIGIDENGGFFYAGPFKHFDTHHTPLSGAVLVESLFGHTKLARKHETCDVGTRRT